MCVCLSLTHTLSFSSPLLKPNQIQEKPNNEREREREKAVEEEDLWKTKEEEEKEGVVAGTSSHSFAL
jgi:hypothetical protein